MKKPLLWGGFFLFACRGACEPPWPPLQRGKAYRTRAYRTRDYWVLISWCAIVVVLHLLELSDDFFSGGFPTRLCTRVALRPPPLQRGAGGIPKTRFAHVWFCLPGCL